MKRPIPSGIAYAWIYTVAIKYLHAVVIIPVGRHYERLVPEGSYGEAVKLCHRMPGGKHRHHAVTLQWYPLAFTVRRVAEQAKIRQLLAQQLV